MKGRRIFVALGVVLCGVLVFSYSVWRNISREEKPLSTQKQSVFSGSDGFKSRISLKATYSRYSLSFQGDMDFLKDGDTNIRVTQPSFMSGFSIKISDDGMTFTLGDKEVSVGAGDSEESFAFAYQMAKTAYHVLSGNELLTSCVISNKDEIASYEFTQNIGDTPYEFKVNVDTKQKKPIDITATPEKKGIDYVLTFENFEFIKNSENIKNS